jgi:carbamoyltransferase
VLALGINAYHGDASAVALVDGRVVAAVEEERFTRRKHEAGFPAHAVRWCLSRAGADVGDIDHLAMSRDPRANIAKKVAWSIRHRPSTRALRSRATNARRVLGVRDAVAEALGVASGQVRAKVHHVEHHRAHLASAGFASPFDEAACISLDGMGDFASSMWGSIRANRCDVRGSVAFPHSLGVFYSAFTQFLGLPAYGDEYKLMGLAAYGKPTYLPDLDEVVRLGDGLEFRLDLDYFTHHDRGLTMSWDAGTPTLDDLYSPLLAERFGAPRPFRGEVTERDCELAASVQARLEEIELELLRRLHQRTGTPRLVLAGGVALNCSVNGRIREETPFTDVWIQPAANDAGTALGAALWVWHRHLDRPRSWSMTHPYLGPEFDAGAIDAALGSANLDARRLDDRELVVRTARRIADGRVVGWYQGATEFGPRALGNRSIVCDPRRADMKDVLNRRIKHREPFRPFAPSVLEHAAGEWFEDATPSPFMLVAVPVRPSRRGRIPAVTHADGTARIQTVSRAENPRYHDLIEEFGRQTGVPLVLNTSLNENEPIVCTPDEAIDCFLRNDMDVLVLGNHLVERSAGR